MQRVHALVVLLLFAGLGHAPAEAEPRIVWQADWDAALALAKKEKKPIMIHFNMDHEPACANMATEHFKNKDVIALAEKFVCVVGSLGEHGHEKTFTGGEECGRFGSVTCAQHRVLESHARGEILETNTVTAPQFVFVNPETEKVIIRRPWDLPVSDLKTLMRRALYYYNPALAPGVVDERSEKLLTDLLKKADSDNLNERRRALDNIAGRDDPRVIQFLIKQTGPDKDLTKRLEAIKAIGEHGNATCLPALVAVLKDRSQRLRKFAMISLGKLGMVEAIEPIIKGYGREAVAGNKAVAVRTVVKCNPNEKKSIDLVGRALRDSKEVVRLHGARCCLEIKVDPKKFKRVIRLARGDTDMSIRASCCNVATRIAVELKDDDGSFLPEKEKIAFEKRRKALMKLAKKDLRSALKKVSKSDKEEALREYAAKCLAYLEGDENIDIESGLERWYREGDLFRDNSTGRRGGRGGGR